MLRRVLVLVGFISIVASVPAFAEGAPRTFSDILRAATDVIVPVEWDGIWQSTDSTYDCTSGTLTNTSSSLDTLCGGKPIFDTLGGGIPLSCTGTANSTSVDITCTGSTTVFPGCDAEFTYHVVASRTGDHFDGQFTTSIHYAGSCSILTDSCNRDSAHADRIAPAPPSYCATPTERTTWGRVKTIYR